MTRLIPQEPEGFRPLGARKRIDVRPDDPALRRSSFDFRGQIDGANLRHAVDDFFGMGRPVVGIQLVEVEPVRFPVLVQAEREVKSGLAFQPLNRRT